MKKLDSGKSEAMTRSQMKNVLGGTGISPEPVVPSQCKARCTCPAGKKTPSGASSYVISISCSGVCVAVDEQYVGCDGGTPTYCNTASNCS